MIVHGWAFYWFYICILKDIFIRNITVTDGSYLQVYKIKTKIHKGIQQNNIERQELYLCTTNIHQLTNICIQFPLCCVAMVNAVKNKNFNV